MKLNECSCGCGGMTGSCLDKHDKEPQSYMFFGNLQTMKRLIDELLSMDPLKIDKILANGHGWAVDHIASSTDDLQEVANFLINEGDHERNHHAKRDPFHEEDAVFLKTFESFVNEVSRSRWESIAKEVSNRKMSKFAERIRSHSKKHGTGFDLAVSVEFGGYDKRVYDYEIENVYVELLSDDSFVIKGEHQVLDAVKPISIEGVIVNDRESKYIKLFYGGNYPALLTKRDSIELKNELISMGLEGAEEIDPKKSSSEHVDFSDIR
jgi:hypothetical protein